MLDPMNFIQLLAIWGIPVLYAITIHEVSHGWVASRLGDKTALILGRLTLNPIKHIDLVGTIIVPGILLMLGGFVFGWAKPVPVNSANFKRPRRDMALVAIAGPISNLLMALLWALFAKLGMIGLQAGGDMAATWEGVFLGLVYMGKAGIMINLVLGVLNLLPIPPLDGSRVLVGFLPGRIALLFDRFEPYGFFFLLILLMMGVLSLMILPPIHYLYGVITVLYQF
jgi:Zn-dependent protease